MSQGEFDWEQDYYRTGLPSVPGDTSEGAAESMRDFVAAMRRRVFLFIVGKGKDGATCDECEVALDMIHQTCSARVCELKIAHLIEDSGNRRPTRSGRNAIVWTELEGNKIPATKATKPAQLEEKIEWLM